MLGCGCDRISDVVGYESDRISGVVGLWSAIAFLVLWVLSAIPSDYEDEE